MDSYFDYEFPQDASWTDSYFDRDFQQGYASSMDSYFGHEQRRLSFEINHHFLF
jgi:hypothetical protein